MNKFIKYLLLASFCFIGTSTNIAIAEKSYKPSAPVEKVNKSLSVVERKVRNAAVKVVSGGGHGSGTLVQYKDLTLVLTAKHVADGVVGSTYLIARENEQRNSTLVYQSKEHDIAVLLLQSSFKYAKPMPWKPTKNYDIGTDIIYSGHPSWHKLMSFEGRIVGYEQDPKAGTQLIVNTYGWFGCSGSGIYNTDGELIGILYGVDVQYTFGVQIQENMIWVAPIKNINIDDSIEAFCRGSIKDYKACK
jgi:S1-C subfamily serine protease|tara:strand:- start:537 stop:1277 length:741 start_codon:yes stop_codon:yes gene_type:complete